MTRWRPSSGARAAESRAALLRRIRDHFERIGMLEVDTPALSPYAVSDTNIESFAVPESEISGGPLFLQT